MFKLKMIKKPILFKLKCDFTFPPIVLANMQEKEAIPTKEQQEIVPDKNYDGLSKVTVNPIPEEYIIPNGNLEINQNGTYDVTDKANAIVDVPEKVLGTKTITKNGTYNATDDNLDGYSKVEVATNGVDINDYFETTYSGTTSNNWALYGNYVKKCPNLVISDNVTSIYNLLGNVPFAPKIICNSNVTNMSYLYNSNRSKSIDVSGLNTSNVTNMQNMFYSCSSLTSLDLSNFITSNVRNISRMFQNCSSLTSLDIRNFDFSNVTSYLDMFFDVPADCLIIVKDDTAKTWITSKFTTLTNVKTVAELGE